MGQVLEVWCDASYVVGRDKAKISYHIEQIDGVIRFAGEMQAVDSTHAELLALRKVIEVLYDMGIQGVTVFSDSMSNIWYINDVKKRGNKREYEDVKDRILPLMDENNIKIHWKKRTFNKAHKLCRFARKGTDNLTRV